MYALYWYTAICTVGAIHRNGMNQCACDRNEIFASGCTMWYPSIKLRRSGLDFSFISVDMARLRSFLYPCGVLVVGLGILVAFVLRDDDPIKSNTFELDPELTKILDFVPRISNTIHGCS